MQADTISACPVSFLYFLHSLSFSSHLPIIPITITNIIWASFALYCEQKRGCTLKHIRVSSFDSYTRYHPLLHGARPQHFLNHLQHLWHHGLRKHPPTSILPTTLNSTSQPQRTTRQTTEHKTPSTQEPSHSQTTPSSNWTNCRAIFAKAIFTKTNSQSLSRRTTSADKAPFSKGTHSMPIPWVLWFGNRLRP